VARAEVSFLFAEAAIMRATWLSRLVVGLLAAWLQAAAVHPTYAAVVRSGDKVTIGADETIEDDLYVFGGEIVIDGTVEGDVCAFGRQITVNGTVTGNVMAAGQTVVIVGEAGGARIAGQVLKIESKAKLAGDLLAAGLSLECEKGSDVTGDALYAGYQALFGGKIGSDLKASMANCRLEGAVGGDVHLKVNGDAKSPSATSFTYGSPPPVDMPEVAGGLKVAKSAELKGDLDYESQNKAEIDPNADIAGDVTFHEQMHAEKEGGEEKAAASGISTVIFKRVRHVLTVALIGITALLLFPRWMTAWADTIRERPLASFASGCVGLGLFLTFCFFMLIAIPLVALILFGIRITELAPVVLIGGGVGYAGVLVAFWIVTMFLAEALVGMVVGRLAVSGESIGGRMGAMIIGMILLGIVLGIPVLGWLIGALVALLGLGSICLWMIGPSADRTTAVATPAIIEHVG
jgi:cytoskeletal protein CcmA (bactofilin family)